METLQQALRNSVVTDNTGARDDGAGIGPPNARLIGGVWMPSTEVHLVEMLYHKKVRRQVNGVETYQYRKLEHAVKLCQQRRVAVDVGGHVGLWAMHLVRLFDSVVAFEPMDSMADIFVYNVNMENCRLNRVALGEHDGNVGLVFDGKNTGHTHISKSAGSVPMRTLDSYQLKNVDFLKVDVEGFEEGVIRGAVETIERCSPVIVCEQKRNDKLRGLTLNGATNYLQSLGYKLNLNYGGDYIMVRQ